MSNQQYFLENLDIYLRDVTLEDVNDNYYNWLNDPEVNQYLETRFKIQSKEMITDFIKSKKNNETEILFAICDKLNDRHIGNIKIGQINWLHRRADISLLIGDKSYWGKGIATQAIQTITKFAFYHLNLNKLMAGAYSTNQGSIKAFLKSNYEIEGEIKDYALINNLGVNMIQLGITANKFNLRGCDE